MGMFSGLQMVNILCSIIKMKLVSIWLQEAGVAIFGILATAQETTSTFTDLGLRQSTVRDVAAQTANPSHLAHIAMLVRRWSVLAGILGASTMLLLSPILGRWFFGSFDGFLPFALVGIAMFFNCLLYGEQSLLQGTGRLRALARGSLWGTIVGLIVSIPMFRLLGLSSVPLSIIAYSLAVYGFTSLYRFRPQHKISTPGLRQLWSEGKPFVRLGILMSLATFLTSLSRLIFTAILTHSSSLDTVGLFQAGDTLVSRYIGLIFTAIGMEFFPRLVTVNSSRIRTNLYVNHEITLLMIVVTPIALLFILCRTMIIDILYTSDFYPILTFISLAVVGSVLKSMSWCMATCIIARGEGRIYLLTEGTDAAISLLLLWSGFELWGLSGIGVAYIAWNLSYTAVTWIVCRHRYGLRLSNTTFRISAISTLLCLGACTAMEFLAPLLCALLIIPAALLYIIPLKRLLARHKKAGTSPE